MVKSLASRAAGLKLTWILLVLLIPIGVLGAFLANALKSDVDFVARERAGARYVSLLMPILLASAANQKDAEAARRYAEEGATLTPAFEMIGGHGDLVRMLTAEKLNHPAIVAAAREHIRLAGQQSGLILDPFAESYHLAAAVTAGVPSLVHDLGKIARISSPKTAASESDVQRLASVALTVGGARESMDRLLQTMRSAKAAGGIADYREIEALSVEFGTHIGDIVNLLRVAEATPGLRRELVHTELTAVSSHLVADARELWTMVQGRLDGLLTKRHDHLWRQMYMMAGGSLLAALLGIGSAIRMFQSTLRKLDEVELAREQEERARAEAEEVSARLEVINSDMAKLNAELSANMAKLSDAQEEITRKGRMEQLGQLTATVAHELRNPLGAVRTSAFLLQRKLKDNSLGVEPQLLRINNGIMRCDDIIAQLLDFSRSTAAVKEPVELDDWLIATIEEQAESIPSAVEIVLQPGLGGLQVAADGARLSRVVSNLLNNAAEALVGRGDDPSKFATSHPKITVETRLSARGAEILVKDNGPGISPEDMPRIMEPLFTTKSFGTGLGLPAVNRILEQHGGGLDIGNNPEGGACFTAWIPVAGEERSAA